MSKYTALAFVLAIFSSIETILAVSAAITGTSVVSGTTFTTPAGSGGGFSFFSTYSLHLSVVGWAAVGVTLLQNRASRRSAVRSAFARMGFGGEVYNLMMGMRGGPSRLALLQSMETPKHRLELSEITGIDWKEVDRQIGILEKYGLVKMYAQSGTVRLYQITEQGRLLIRLTGELDRGAPNHK